MVLKIKNYVLLTFLIFVQSCSGGRVGNFFESIFDEEKETKTKIELRKTLKNKNLDNPEEKTKEKETKTKIELRKTLKNNNLDNPEEKLKENNIIKNKLLKKRKYKPQSYKIILFLKDVDPKAPIEDISNILRNSNVDFEIEKIERFFDSDKKNLRKNKN